MEKSTIEVEDLEEGDDFLLELAAIEAEAQAASAKRSRVSTPEGPYMAALKGSKSEQWQSSPLNPASKSRGGFQRSDGGGSVSVNSNPPGNYGADQEFPEKNCSCGLGVCSIFTSNTQKNPGRKFYRCPAKEENGGCGFFQWCDADAVQSSSGTYSSGSKFPDLQCPCGSGLCRVLTAKTGENVGRQFYRCPVFEGSCGFFKWCNDDAVNSPTMHSYTKTSNLGGSDTRGYQVAKTGTPCYKCGKEGHWARDCTVQSGTPVSQTGPVKSSAAAGDCYKCGKQGHWSRDCTAQTGNPMSETGPVKSTSDCYKCGKQGHWSRDCPAQSGNPMSETGSVKSTAATGDCYKCGKQGHWARDCTAQSGNPMAESGQVKSSSSTGECYKCGKNGHWARDCTGGSGNQEFQSGQGKTGSSGGDCYKCGKPGHWARDCTSAGQSINTQGKRPRQ